jgi:hypothetical protein
MNGYITHDGLWNARMQFGWDDPAGERLGDIVEGLEWFMGREAYVEENGLVYVPSEFSLTNHPAKSTPSYKLPFESYYSILLPLLTNGEEYTPGLLEKAVKSGFAAGLREDGFTYLDHPGCQTALYYLLHQKKSRTAGAPPEGVKDLAVEALGGGKVKLTWTSPAGAAKFQARFSPRKMVPNLNYMSDKRKYEFDPKEFANWWAAEHLQGEPAGKPGEKQSFTAEGLKPGTYFFALRVWDPKNRRSAISNQVQVEVR